mmetsp:Transcript_105345/g.307959  ORF Transcript_105345/g.307959 Transcript_105345/m.307959 type:complete len:219 (-) Transcript_105345:238-894(-)
MRRAAERRRQRSYVGAGLRGALRILCIDRDHVNQELGRVHTFPRTSMLEASKVGEHLLPGATVDDVPSRSDEHHVVEHGPDGGPGLVKRRDRSAVARGRELVEERDHSCCLEGVEARGGLVHQQGPRAPRPAWRQRPAAFAPVHLFAHDGAGYRQAPPLPLRDSAVPIGAVGPVADAVPGDVRQADPAQQAVRAESGVAVPPGLQLRGEAQGLADGEL